MRVIKDIQIGARIPQETADNLINVVEHMRSIHRGAVVSTSSVVRDAIDVYADMKLNKKIAVSVQALEDKNETCKELLEELSRLAHDTHNEQIKAFVDGLVKRLLIERLADRVDELEMAARKSRCLYCKTQIIKCVVFAKNNDGLPSIDNPRYCPNCGKKLKDVPSCPI